MKANQVHPDIRLAMLRKYMEAYIDYLCAREQWRARFRVKDCDPGLTPNVCLFPTFDEWVEWQVSEFSKFYPTKFYSNAASL